MTISLNEAEVKKAVVAWLWENQSLSVSESNVELFYGDDLVEAVITIA